MAGVIYALCALAALSCAVLLLRGYRKNQASLLLWAGLCFLGLTLNNTLVVIDMVFVPETDMRLIRVVTGLISISTLLVGLIFQKETAT